MNAALAAGLFGLGQFLINEWIDYNARKGRPADYKPTPEDVARFLAEIANDTPDNIKAEVARQLGVTWPLGT